MLDYALAGIVGVVVFHNVIMLGSIWIRRATR